MQKAHEKHQLDWAINLHGSSAFIATAQPCKLEHGFKEIKHLYMSATIHNTVRERPPSFV